MAAPMRRAAPVTSATRPASDSSEALLICFSKSPRESCCDSIRPANGISPGADIHCRHCLKAWTPLQAVMPNRTSLPSPDAASSAHSDRVAEFLRERIRAGGGSVSFAEFMHHALYAPGLGYYVSGNRKFGAAGDFITAPETSPLFGKIVARQCATVLDAVAGGNILELGAGSGALAATVLETLGDTGQLPAEYLVLEVSPELVERQRNAFQQRIPGHLDRVRWVDAVPPGFDGVILANEVADALPVERFRIKNDGVQQARVAADGNAFALHFETAPDFVVDAVRAIETSIGSTLPDGFVSEVSPGLKRWIGDIAASMNRGLIMLFDYGVPRREYYAGDRHGGWLRCYFRHHVHHDPLILPGIQDLTSWVDFTAIAEAAAGQAMQVAGFVSQADFLIHGGLEEALAGFDELPVQARAELSRQVKLLTLPGEMGEHFKCIGLGRGDFDVPAALTAGDRAHLL